MTILLLKCEVTDQMPHHQSKKDHRFLCKSFLKCQASDLLLNTTFLYYWHWSHSLTWIFTRITRKSTYCLVCNKTLPWSDCKRSIKDKTLRDMIGHSAGFCLVVASNECTCMSRSRTMIWVVQKTDNLVFVDFDAWCLNCKFNFPHPSFCIIAPCGNSDQYLYNLCSLTQVLRHKIINL